MKENQQESDNKWCKLFAFADSTDYVLVVLETIAARSNGLTLPLMTILFGELDDSFEQGQR